MRSPPAPGPRAATRISPATRTRYIRRVTHRDLGRHRGDRAILDLVERLLAEAEALRDKHGREGLDRGVEVAHRRVVVAPRLLHLVLDRREFRLQLAEIGVGLQLRIGLGDGDQPAERARERLVGRRLAGDVAGAHAGRALLGDLLEDALLMRRIALHRLDEIGDEVGAPLQLHVDAAPALAGEIALPHEAIVERDGIEADDGDDGDDDQR